MKWEKSVVDRVENLRFVSKAMGSNLKDGETKSQRYAYHFDATLLDFPLKKPTREQISFHMAHIL